MNIIIAPQRSLALPSSLRHSHSLSSLAHRFARSIGLRLLLWGSHRHPAIDRAHHAQQWQQHEARSARELQWESRARHAPLR